MRRSEAARRAAPDGREARALGALSEPRVALITGALGFGGRHLVAALRNSAWELLGLVRHQPPDSSGSGLRLVEADLLQPAALGAVIRDVAPDYVFHLAAATPPAGDRECFDVNVRGATSLLEALGRHCPEASVLVVGSDAQYGPLDPTFVPTRESAPMRPVGAYGRSKVLQETVALRYATMTGLRVVCVRPFNYIGPGQSDHFVVSHIARQIARAERGDRECVVELGSVAAMRDFTDVRDMAHAFIRALLLGSDSAVYNVGSGTPHSIGEVAATLAGMATRPMAVRSLPGRARPGEVAITTCDSSLFRQATGWAPEVPLEQTLSDTLAYWREIGDASARCPGSPIPGDPLVAQPQPQ